MARTASKKAGAAAAPPPARKQTASRSKAPAPKEAPIPAPAPARIPAEPLPPSPTITVVPPTAPTPLAASTPAAFQLPLVFILSLAFSALFKSIFRQLNGPELTFTDQDGNQQWRATIIVAWKAVELAIVWLCNFDATDTFAFSLLTHIPHTYFIRTFYLLPWAESTVLILISSIADYLAVWLLRPSHPIHLPTPQTDEQIASDPTIRLLVTLLGTVAYSIPLLFSFATWLPTHLATYFTSLTTLDPAHHQSLPTLSIPLLPLGWLILRYIFDPAAHSLSSAAPTEYTFPPDFDPVTATLSQTLHRNILWHLYLPARAQELFKRILVLMICTLVSSTLFPWLEIDGCELYGAFGWASVWGLGAGLAGLALGWVAGILN